MRARAGRGSILIDCTIGIIYNNDKVGAKLDWSHTGAGAHWASQRMGAVSARR